MDQVFKVLSSISSFFYRLLPFVIIAVLVVGVMLLLQLSHFTKKLEITQKKTANLSAKTESMEQSFLSSTSAPGILGASNYQDLQFKSQMARSALGFTLDNSGDILNWSQKAIRVYKKLKKKRNK